MNDRKKERKHSRTRLKRFGASISTCPFQIQHAIFRTDEPHPPAVWTEVKAQGQRSQGMVTLEWQG